MYLICIPCIVKEETKIKDCRLCLGKYYPNTGWYDSTGSLSKDLGEFFEKHKHGTMFGEDFTIVYESVFGGFHAEKRMVLEALTEHVIDIQNGKGNKPR
jgi:hypothetical protein